MNRWPALTGPRRRRIYRVAVAIGSLLVVRQVLDADEAAAWLEVVGAALLPAAAELAARNVPSDEV